MATALCVAAPGTTDELLQHADQIKRISNSDFQTLLKQLDTQAGGLTGVQRDWLDYLHAWQLGYQGEYPQALQAFGILLAHTQDPTVRARARISLIDDQVNSAHYEDAYATISTLLDSLPKIEDRNAHFLALASASSLYNEAGQYDLALRYIDQALAYDQSDSSTCISLTTKAETLYRSGTLRVDDAQIQGGLEACQRVGESIFSNLIRQWLAQAQLDHGNAAGALELLESHDAEVLGTHSSALTSQFRSLLARCFLLTGDLAHAREYAQSAINFANKQIYSKAVVDANEVLYEIAKRQGDDTAALAYHEKYAVADKGYRSEESAKTLAYQMVAQQVREKKLQIDALSKQNQVLQLKQQVNAKNAEAGKLLLLLLATVLASIGLYAYRTKRSQLKFMNLARRDGLTGIFNRQHFIETSEDILAYAAKSVRDACVIVIDLDHFKDVNDTHGHAAGDMVLKSAVAACQAQLRSVDVFGRLGGEEFGILLPDCVPERAADIAEQMRNAIATLCDGKDNAIDFPVNASFGVSAARWSGYDLRQLLAHADSALYRAKRDGRNRIAIYDDKSDLADKLPSGMLDRRRG